ncbi:nitrate ABC transporter substrate-binding protein [Cnuibacter physcomitrellae]|uniref:Nitrate ABC transporter substrate-binding protein n=1 Tax=Cnuibacter physcomitrellae TaxID=1619308 RepID=A0A1X9LL46_9MICO|nr:nitrate ABC transporter substrate-binding protein [Cnuibacter physcomitrellae]ARJ05903.1 nitrate ABC transporter substrate-binding protein [Cnuibacter physcomitrellae]GGI36756.1 nitrate ABC transporter substrate-binding protein [Cnuibacter physcomitrellae]
MRTPRSRLILAAGLTVVSAAALTACSSGSSASTGSSSDLTVGSIDLAAAGCPSTIVMQTDWNPEAEHGHWYQMVGANPTIDSQNKTVTGPLMAGGEYTGVDIQIRAGGPAIGFQTVSSQMYTDDDIMLGYVSTDEAIQLSQDMPTKAVYTPLEIAPTMLMWDPATYPDATSIKDVVADGATVRYFEGSSYMEYLMSAGIIPREQTDGSYDGTPASFVAAGGKDAQQGFASAEPYIYQNEVSSWGKPVKYTLINDLGYPIYYGAVSVRADKVDQYSDCLKALVPVMQQAEVDYYADPQPAIDLILQLVQDYDTGWVYSQGVADYSVKTQLDLGLVGNGTNDTVGDFDDARIADVFDKIVPVFDSLGTPPADGLTVSDIYTNEFIDPSISLTK